MIHLAFEGGLGNQLFQYAFGRYCENLFKDSVSYDISKYKFESCEEREFELKSFAINANWKKEILHKNRFQRFGFGYLLYLTVTIPYLQVRKRIHKKNSQIDSIYQTLINSFGFYRVHYGNYKISHRTIFKNKYIRGHWFWKEMVAEMRDVLNKELQVVTPLNATNKNFLEQIKSANSVGVHIRRGDYVTLGLIACNIKYYEACIKRMSEIENNAVFFIFSDDIPWVKDNLKVEAPLVFIDNNNPSPEDMRLLYSCNHFIMSNSTFSWWGAFLGKCPSKKVMCPRYWDIKNMKKESSLIFDEWIKIDNSQYL